MNSFVFAALISAGIAVVTLSGALAGDIFPMQIPLR